MKTNCWLWVGLFALYFLSLESLGGAGSPDPRQQISIPEIEKLPNRPSDFERRDWKAVAIKYNGLVSNFDAEGKYIPLVRWDRNTPNFRGLPTPYTPSFVGIDKGGDGLNLFGTIIGASLAGIDKSNHQGENWVLSMKQFYGISAGRRVVGNNKRQTRSTGLWYDVVPGIYLFQAVDLYPETSQIQTPYQSGEGSASMLEVMRETATEWHSVLDFLGGGETGTADFWGVVGFDTVTMEIDDRDGRHPGVPESAAGLAWIQYMAYLQFDDPKYLEGVEWALSFLENTERSPLHNGVQFSYGSLVMARMNAEFGRDYDLQRMIRWSFGEGEPLRKGWGVLYGSWGGREVGGLIGSSAERGGARRAYALQGFHMVGALAPLVRYDPRYARAIGKWMLHKASSSRHYYQTYLPDEYRDSPFWEGDPDGVIPFESLRGLHSRSYFQDYARRLAAANQGNPEVKTKLRKAIADPPPLWASGRTGAVLGGIGLCPYFGGAVGYLGAVVSPTNQDEILRIDLLATDFFRDKAYPTYLYYNPFDESKEFELDVGPNPIHLYDTVSGKVLFRNVTGTQNIQSSADSAVVLVFVPAGVEGVYEGSRLMVDGVVVDYNARPAPPLERE
jgi:hypothetical protein